MSIYASKVGNFKKYTLSTLCVTSLVLLFSTNGYAGPVTGLNTSGTLTPGTYTGITGSFLATASAGSSMTPVNVTVDVGDGTGTIVLGDSTTPINTAYILNADSSNPGNSPGHLVYNGNLVAYVSRTSSTFYPIMANYTGSSVTVNGDVTLDGKIERSSYSNMYLVQGVDNGFVYMNGDVDLKGTSISQDSWADLYGVYANPNFSTSLTPVTAYVQVGDTSSDTANIHDLFTSAATGAEAVGVLAYGCAAGAPTTIDLLANTSISNISAVTSGLDTDNHYAIAAGIYAQNPNAVVNVFADLSISDITASGTNAEAYAIAAYDTATVNVNTALATAPVIQIAGHVVAMDAGVVNLNLLNSTSYLHGQTYVGTVDDVNAGIINVYLDNGASWNLTGNSGLTSLHSVNSFVDLRQSSGNSTLTVSDLDMNGATFYLNTYFDGNGTTTDRIVVNGGDATGTATLRISSVGTDGALTPKSSNGIMVVDLTGANNKSAVFTLNGDVMDFGAYEYNLTQGIDENWYLTTNGVQTNTSRTINNMPALHLAIVRSGMNELRKRIGDLRNDYAAPPQGLWVQAYGKHLKVNDTIKSTMPLFGIESGVDFDVPVDFGNLYVGFMGGAISADNIRVHQTTISDGSGRTIAPNAGLYASLMGNNGWFADATMRYFWIDMAMNNIAADGSDISYDMNRGFVTTSMEVGKKFNISSFTISPKTELQYAHAASGQSRTNTGSDISYDATSSLLTRLALHAAYFNNGKKSSWQTFAEIGVLNEWMGETKMNFAGLDYVSELDGIGFETRLGVMGNLSNNLYFYGDISYEIGSVYQIISGNIGIRYPFSIGGKKQTSGNSYTRPAPRTYGYVN